MDENIWKKEKKELTNGLLGVPFVLPYIFESLNNYQEDSVSFPWLHGKRNHGRSVMQLKIMFKWVNQLMSNLRNRKQW